MQNQRHLTLIIDDEADARNVLRRLVERFCPHLQVCAEAGTVADALTAIREHRPALVFLDVDLRHGDGFDVLDAFPHPEFKVVFTTAYDEFAVKAFKYRALHYLLKPIDPDDLVTVTRELRPSATFLPDYEALLQSIHSRRPEKILLPSVQGTVVVQPDEILYVLSDEKYATAVLASGEKVFIGLSLKDLEALLPAGEFLRPHQSYIVRTDAIRKVQKGEGLVLLLKDKTEIPVSRRNKEDVLRILGIGVDG